MRDISPGRDLNVHGDLSIHDQSKQQYKLLNHCSNNELIAEGEHRRRVLDGERIGKRKIIFRLLGFAAGVLLAALIYFYWQGNMNFVTMALGGREFCDVVGSAQGIHYPERV